MIKRRLIQDIRPPRCQRHQGDFSLKPNFRSQQTGAIKSGRRTFSVITKLLFISFIILVVSAGVFFVTPTGRMYAQVFAMLTQGKYQLKIFVRDSGTIEAVVNDWLASQENITVDQIKANSYVGNFMVIVRYYSGGSGKVSTRIKIFDANTLAGAPESGFETAEAWAQNLISSLSSEHNIRSADVFTGDGPWDIFVVYDDEQGQVQDETYKPVELIPSFDEPVEQNVENVEQAATSTSPASTIDANTDSEPETMETVSDNASAPTEAPATDSTNLTPVIQENGEAAQ